MSEVTDFHKCSCCGEENHYRLMAWEERWICFNCLNKTENSVEFIIEEDLMRPVLITWYFDPRTGDIKLDCLLELDDPNQVQAVRMVYVRAGVQNASPALLHIPGGATRQDIEMYIEDKKNREDVLLKLNKARVKENEIIRKKLATNAIDFLAGGN